MFAPFTTISIQNVHTQALALFLPVSLARARMRALSAHPRALLENGLPSIYVSQRVYRLRRQVAEHRGEPDLGMVK